MVLVLAFLADPDFQTVKRQLPSISDRALIARLKQLEGADLVRRTTHSHDRRVKFRGWVRYSLTSRGATMVGAIQRSQAINAKP